METFKNRWVPPDKGYWPPHELLRSDSDTACLKEHGLTWETLEKEGWSAQDLGRDDDGSFTTVFRKKEEAK